ncbi:hypothetical protein [Pseudomonas yamanorum]|uniref:hypothetical protein n=1 Tax=Pseudomonas yamanorum TaxID=515393 RepID=UPI003D369963
MRLKDNPLRLPSCHEVRAAVDKLQPVVGQRLVQLSARAAKVSGSVCSNYPMDAIYRAWAVIALVELLDDPYYLSDPKSRNDSFTYIPRLPNVKPARCSIPAP